MQTRSQGYFYRNQDGINAAASPPRAFLAVCACASCTRWYIGSCLSDSREPSGASQVALASDDAGLGFDSNPRTGYQPRFQHWPRAHLWHPQASVSLGLAATRHCWCSTWPCLRCAIPGLVKGRVAALPAWCALCLECTAPCQLLHMEQHHGNVILRCWPSWGRREAQSFWQHFSCVGVFDDTATTLSMLVVTSVLLVS